MGQLAVSVVGAGVGFVVSGFNPAGAAVGWSLGSAVGGILFAPDGPNVRGPRLDDLTVQASTQGQPVVRVFGTVRTAGNVIWSTDIEEHEHEEDIEGGGKGGGGGGTSTTFTYTANFALGLCEGPISGVRKIWADGKLIYDKGDPDNIDALVASTDLADDIRIYLGTETQEPDSLIQGVEGIDNTPAYRGLAYIVFDDFELADFGNRIPNITAEVTTGDLIFPEILIEDRPPTSGGNIQESAPGDTDDGGYLWQRTDRGVIEYIGNVQYHDGNTTSRTFYRRIYTLDGELQETQPVGLSVTGTAYWKGSSPASVTVRGPVRGLSDVYACSIREQGGGFADYACFLHSGVNPYPVPLRTPNNEPFAQVDGVSLVPGVGDTSVDLFPISQAYGDGVYALLGQVEGSGNKRVYKFPLEDGYPGSTAVAEYIGDQAGTFDDLYVDADGVWIVGAQPSVIPEEGFLIHLDHDLEFIEEWTVPNPDDTRLTGPYVVGDQAVYGIQGGFSGQWHIVQLNDDGTSTELSTGTASGAGTQQGYAPILPGLGLLQRLRWLTLGLLEPTEVTLASIVRSLCNDGGLTEFDDFDVSTLENDLVRGYALARPSSIREALEPLQRGFFFDIIESDFILKFPKRGGDAIATIPEANLAAHAYGDARPQELRRKRRQDLEIPRRVHVQYLDPDRDYQAGEQWAGRLQTQSVGVEIVTLPIVFTPDEARPIADGLLYDAWVTRDEYELYLGPDYIYLDAADTITVTLGNATHYIRLTNTDFRFPNMIAAQGVSVRPPAYTAETLSQGSLGNTYESPAPGANSPVEQPMQQGIEGPSLVVLIDSPLLRDADDNAGIYHAGRGYTDGWRGYGLFKSLDGGGSFVQIDTHFQAATMGLTTDALGNPASGFTIIDEGNTVNVRVNGTLSSISDVLFYNRTQLALVGIHGRWEVIAFQNAELEADGTYTLSTLMRGLKGTDAHVSTHAVGDYFILLSATTIDRVLVDLAEIGVERVYKGVSAGQTVQETEAQDFTLGLEGLKPLSPVHVRGRRNTSLDLVITWVRRTRIGGAWDVAGFTPLGEASESYSIDILNGSTVVRTISASSQTTTYTAAQQVTDFGSTQASVSGRLYQISATVGRGTARSFTV